jgi:Rod binding domain-containing protein
MGSSAIGMGSLSSQASLQQVREDQMLQQMKGQNGANDDAKIEKGSKQFEAMLLGTWLQQAEQSFATIPGAEDDDDAAGRDQMMSLGVQSLAESMAASGGIGIAKMIAKAMEATAHKAEATAPGKAEPAPVPAPAPLPSQSTLGNGKIDERP